MEVIIQSRRCPHSYCDHGIVQFKAGVINVSKPDQVVRGRCDKCHREYEQPLALVQSEDLIPLNDD